MFDFLDDFLRLFLISPFAVRGMCYENFSTDWTETDPNNRLSQTATRSTFTGLSVNESAGLQRTAGVNFTGDWSIAFDFYINSTSTNVSPDTHYNLPNFFVLYDVTELKYQGLYIQDWNGTNILVGLEANDLGGSGEYVTNNNALSVNTTYYLLFRRAEAASTNGTLYVDIYGTSANRDSQTGALVSLSLPITVMGKVDMVTNFAPYTVDFDVASNLTGYLENLDLAYVPPVTAVFRRRIITYVTSFSLFFINVWRSIYA